MATVAVVVRRGGLVGAVGVREMVVPVVVGVVVILVVWRRRRKR